MNDSYLKQKYFSKDFNLIEFAMKCNTNFIPAASWRTIGGNHTAHISVIQISLQIIEYGLLNQKDMEVFELNLFSKVSVLHAMEEIFDNEANTKRLSRKVIFQFS